MGGGIIYKVSELNVLSMGDFHKNVCLEANTSRV